MDFFRPQLKSTKSSHFLEKAAFKNDCSVESFNLISIHWWTNWKFHALLLSSRLLPSWQTNCVCGFTTLSGSTALAALLWRQPAAKKKSAKHKKICTQHACTPHLPQWPQACFDGPGVSSFPAAVPSQPAEGCRGDVQQWGETRCRCCETPGRRRGQRGGVKGGWKTLGRAKLCHYTVSWRNFFTGRISVEAAATH